MDNSRINRYFGAMVVGVALMAVPACTDTWDDHYDSSESASGTTKTLWDVISENPNYSRFAEIARNAYYYKDNTHPVPTYTYADILKGGQVNTVWLPNNNALTEAEFNKWMEMLGDSRASDDISAGYDVQQQFLGNHIALWRHNISEPGVDTVKMINGKNLVFDKTKKTFAGHNIEEYNIPTMNGVMHVIDGIAPFRYNFYEYLKFPSQGETRSKLGEYVVSKDTTYFSASSSIEGLPDELGNPTYVDSVYYTSNRLFESTSYVEPGEEETWQMAEQGFGARINVEDSVFIMVMPTDAAWDATYEMLKPSHIYATTYDHKVKGDDNASETIKGIDADSLQKMSIEMDMVSPLVFNLHKQPKRGGSEMWTLDLFKQFKGDGGNPTSPNDYLYNTFRDTLRNIGDWDKTSLFGDAEPVEMSNGLAYKVDSWNFPKEYYTPDVEVEISSTNMFYNVQSTRYKMGTAHKSFSFSNEAYKDITDIYGHVSHGNFYHFDSPGPTSGPKVDIKLYGNDANAYVPDAQVMSGKYDIQIVVVPHWYIDIANAGEIEDKFYVQHIDTIVNPEDITDTTFVSTPTGEIDQEYIETLASTNKYKIKATLSYNNNAAKDKTQASKVIDYDGLKVDTLTVIEDFNFPYSYKNMRFTYPTLYIEGSTGKTDAKNGYVYDLVIDKIILKRKD